MATDKHTHKHREERKKRAEPGQRSTLADRPLMGFGQWPWLPRLPAILPPKHTSCSLFLFFFFHFVGLHFPILAVFFLSNPRQFQKHSTDLTLSDSATPFCHGASRHVLDSTELRAPNASISTRQLRPNQLLR